MLNERLKGIAVPDRRCGNMDGFVRRERFAEFQNVGNKIGVCNCAASTERNEFSAPKLAGISVIVSEHILDAAQMREVRQGRDEVWIHDMPVLCGAERSVNRFQIQDRNVTR